MSALGKLAVTMAFLMLKTQKMLKKKKIKDCKKKKALARKYDKKIEEERKKGNAEKDDYKLPLVAPP